MTDERSDETLLQQWIGGDEAAGEILFDRHFDSVCRFLRPKVSHGLEDLVQQVFLGCVEGRERFQGTSSFRAYLFGIARRQLLNHYRQCRKGAVLDFGVTSLSDMGTSPTGTLAREDDRRLIEAALQQLPLDQQLALELMYWQNLTGPEVAEALEVPLDTAYTRIRRARARLGELLGELDPHEFPDV